MNRKIFLYALGILSALTFALGITIPAHAAQAQICNDRANSKGGPLCLNVAGGQHNIGNAITGYTPNNVNGEFQYVGLIFACGDGHVHSHPAGVACPFPDGSGLNAQYDGAAIVALNDASINAQSNTCAGMSTNNSTLVEQPCPGPDGTGGGGYGVLWVLRSITDEITQRHTLTAMINVHVSSLNGVGEIACAYFKSTSVFMGLDQASNIGECRWHEP